MGRERLPFRRDEASRSADHRLNLLRLLYLELNSVKFRWICRVINEVSARLRLLLLELLLDKFNMHMSNVLRQLWQQGEVGFVSFDPLE